MELGLAHFPTDYGIQPAELARAAEERGFESLFLPEHTHIPVSRDTPYPGGGELPPEYSHTLDPFVALAAAAAVTERLKLGTGVCLIIERDPIVTAKEVATLDHLSGGRFLFGVGAGWNIEEMENHGTDPQHALPPHARERGGDEGDLDRGRGRVPREDRRLRPDLVLAEAGAEAAPAGARRRARRQGARPRGGLRRRVDPEPGEEPGGARRADRGAPAPCGGGRPRAHPGHGVRREAGGAAARAAAGRGRDALALLPAPRGARRGAAPARSSSPRWRRNGTARPARPVAVALQVRLQGAARGGAGAARRAAARLGREAARL